MHTLTYAQALNEGIVAVDRDADKGAVLVLEASGDLRPAIGLEIQQHALFLPAHEILQGLEDRHVGLELLVFQLLIDLLQGPDR